MEYRHDPCLHAFLYGKRSSKEDILDEFTRLCTYAHTANLQIGIEKDKKEIVTYVINTFCPDGCTQNKIWVACKGEVPFTISDWRLYYLRSRRIIIEGRTFTFESYEFAEYIYRQYQKLLENMEMFIAKIKEALIRGLFLL